MENDASGRPDDVIVLVDINAWFAERGFASSRALLTTLGRSVPPFGASGQSLRITTCGSISLDLTAPSSRPDTARDRHSLTRPRVLSADGRQSKRARPEPVREYSPDRARTAQDENRFSSRTKRTGRARRAALRREPAVLLPRGPVLPPGGGHGAAGALACLLVRSFDRGSPASARRRDSRRTAAETPKVSVDTSTRPTPSAPAGGRQPDHHAGLLGVGEHGRARDEPPDVTARHRVGDDADRDVGHQPVAAHPPAVGVLLTHRPPCPPPSRVPSPGYAFPQPLTRVTIVI